MIDRFYFNEDTKLFSRVPDYVTNFYNKLPNPGPKFIDLSIKGNEYAKKLNIDFDDWTPWSEIPYRYDIDSELYFDEIIEFIDNKFDKKYQPNISEYYFYDTSLLVYEISCQGVGDIWYDFKTKKFLNDSPQFNKKLK